MVMLYYKKYLSTDLRIPQNDINHHYSLLRATFDLQTQNDRAYHPSKSFESSHDHD